MSEIESAEFPEQFTHSVKISDTAKGIRIDVHVYATDKKTAVEEALATYLLARDEAAAENIPLAPVEIKRTEDLESIAYRQQREVI